LIGLYVSHNINLLLPSFGGRWEKRKGTAEISYARVPFVFAGIQR